MILLSANNLGHAFAGKTLFESLKLGLSDGEKVGLIGPNGVGKSTLFKILSKKINPIKGDVVWSKGLKLGYLEQTPTFANNISILDAILEKSSDPDMDMGTAYSLLSKLDLIQFGESFLVKELSGGWQKRVALARELVIQPDVLFMDEPTNHLDVTSILWLEEFIEQSAFTFFIITHDQLFLERTCNKFIDLDPKNPDFILVHEGDYASYIENKEMLLQGQLQREKSLSNVLRRETEWLRRGAQARQTKQKGRIQRAEELKGEVGTLSDKNRSKKLDFEFGTQNRSPNKLVEIQSVTKGYNNKNLFENLDLIISQKTRLAIMGENGCGKSTLIKILTGQLEPDTGIVKITPGVKILSFEQNRETLNQNLSLLKNICPDGDYVYFQNKYIHVQSYLDQFLFARSQNDLPVGKLSGGEQARLRIAQLMLQEGNLLILDEPTNDLDRGSLEVLQDSLKNFNGAVVLVTHDRFFMDQVATQIISFTPKDLQIDDKKVYPLETFSDYFQWEQWYEQELKKMSSKVNSKGVATANNSDSSKINSSPNIKLSFKEKYELEKMESFILELEEKLKSLQNEIQLPEVTSNIKIMGEKCSLISELEIKIETSYKRWADLEARDKS